LVHKEKSISLLIIRRKDKMKSTKIIFLPSGKAGGRKIKAERGGKAK